MRAPGLISEDPEHRRLRVWRLARTEWASLPRASKNEFGARARSENRQVRKQQIQDGKPGCKAAHNARNKKRSEVVAVPELRLGPRSTFDAAAAASSQMVQVQVPAQAVDAATMLPTLGQGPGPWGLGDGSWGLSKAALLSTASSEIGFVKQNDLQWRVGHNEVVPAQDEAIDEASDSSKNLDLTFCQKLDGCYHVLPQAEQLRILAMLEFLRNVARSHRGLLDTRPAGILLFLDVDAANGSGAASSSSDILPCPLQAFVVCNVSLNPLDVCLWSCKVEQSSLAPVAGRADMKAVSMLATVDYQQHVGPSGAVRRMPVLLSMHQFAYRFKSVDMASKRCKLLFQYKVESLNRISLTDLQVDCNDCNGLQLQVAALGDLRKPVTLRTGHNMEGATGSRAAGDVADEKALSEVASAFACLQGRRQPQCKDGTEGNRQALPSSKRKLEKRNTADKDIDEPLLPKAAAKSARSRKRQRNTAPLPGSEKAYMVPAADPAVGVVVPIEQPVLQGVLDDSNDEAGAFTF